MVTEQQPSCLDIHTFTLVPVLILNFRIESNCLVPPDSLNHIVDTLC